MNEPPDFEMRDFLPYLLAQAAEEVSLEFQKTYKSRYGMLRTEWRVLFHLGRYGSMTATDISQRAKIHKTKISRAVAKLEARRFLRREVLEKDRRLEQLRITSTGRAAYRDLTGYALAYHERLMSRFSIKDRVTLQRCLLDLAKLPPDPGP